MIRVSVAGAAGRMGRAVCDAVEAADGMELVGRVDPNLGTTVADVLPNTEVLVDFTQPTEALGNINKAVAAGVHCIVGTTGFEIDDIELTGGEGKVFVAPNFAIGAVLMMKFASEAARHMESAEIVELHHPGKLDSPSGTAKRTAELMTKASGREVPIHSVRLPGVVANQEVIFGDLAQTLTLRHDTTDRACFMPGVILAIRKVAYMPKQLVVGLEHIL